MKRIGVGIVIGLVVLGIVRAQVKQPNTVELAGAFIGSLNPSQKAKAMKAFDDEYRMNWRFVPANRDGIHLDEITPEQTEKAVALLKSSLSDSGYKKVEQIRGLEDVLFELENKNPGRNKMRYEYTFFGMPSKKEPWGWRFEGHHISLNFTFKGEKLISSTPQFFGANPAIVESGPKKGLQTLAEERDVAFELLNSFSEEQKKKAVIVGEAPADIVTGNSRKAGIQADTGIAYKDMTPDQQKTLVRLVKVYASAQSALEFDRRWKRVEPKTLVFAWMGSTQNGKGHYYRIQGSKFLIEYDNTQTNANHIHAVWRDFNGDFGEDMLAEHYAASPHDESHHHHDHN